MNRARRARELAGLSVGQAAKLLGMTAPVLRMLEIPECELKGDADKLAALYRVGAEWIRGEGPDRDYESIRNMRGHEKLSDHDRDVIAEFAAGLRGVKVTPWKERAPAASPSGKTDAREARSLDPGELGWRCNRCLTVYGMEVDPVEIDTRFTLPRMLCAACGGKG